MEPLLPPRFPVNLRALGALKAPRSMDLYIWLTYRLNTLSKPVTVLWKDLHIQCGSRLGHQP